MRYLVQPAWNFVTACIFEYGIAMFDLDLGDHIRDKRNMSPEKKAEVRVTLRKAGRQLTKDFVLYPALSGRGWRSTQAGPSYTAAQLPRSLRTWCPPRRRSRAYFALVGTRKDDSPHVTAS